MAIKPETVKFSPATGIFLFFCSLGIASGGVGLAMTYDEMGFHWAAEGVKVVASLALTVGILSLLKSLRQN